MKTKLVDLLRAAMPHGDRYRAHSYKRAARRLTRRGIRELLKRLDRQERD